MVTTIERGKQTEPEKVLSFYPWTHLVHETRREILNQGRYIDFNRRFHCLYLPPREVLARLADFAGEKHEDFPSSTLQRIKSIADGDQFSSLREPYKLLLKIDRYRERQLRKRFEQNKFRENGYQTALEVVIGEQLAIIAELNPRKFDKITSNGKK